ncbi:MAG: acylphosphatase [Acidimicrobiia bacterium]|nr:acylphosphatase [Acidimicrobiia bacterium]
MSEVGARRCVVTGRVQGVGFRWWAKQAADELGVAGWVQNGAGGEVELMVQGQDVAVEAYLKRLADGPPMAAVDDVAVSDAEVEAELDGFEISG